MAAVVLDSSFGSLLTSRFCCYRCGTLFNYNRYSCTWAFFNLTEWLKDYLLDLYLNSIFWISTISHFWVCWGWKIIILDERNIFLGHQVLQVHQFYRISTTFWFVTIPSFKLWVHILSEDLHCASLEQSMHMRIQQVSSKKPQLCVFSFQKKNMPFMHSWGQITPTQEPWMIYVHLSSCVPRCATPFSLLIRSSHKSKSCVVCVSCALWWLHVTCLFFRTPDDSCVYVCVALFD